VHDLDASHWGGVFVPGATLTYASAGPVFALELLIHSPERLK
jgi:hypothetical protein